jgi:hypothetical protein
LFGTPYSLAEVHRAVFYRSSPSSTNLDSWQHVQLRTMKVGGNGSATEFFTRHGGASLLTDTDVKKKYTSRVAELYKEELARRIKEDVSQCAVTSICHLASTNVPNIMTQVPERHRR